MRTGEEDLVKEPVGLVEMEHEVELADVAEVLVKHLHEVVDHIERQQLVVGAVDGANKVQARVALVHKLEVRPVQEVAKLHAFAPATVSCIAHAHQPEIAS